MSRATGCIKCRTKVSAGRWTRSSQERAGSGKRARDAANTACATGAASATTNSGAAKRSGGHDNPRIDSKARPQMTRYHSGISGSHSKETGAGSYSD